MGGSPGSVVRGGETCSEGFGFQSQHRILDGYFFTLISCNNNIDVCLKKTENKSKETVDGPFKIETLVRFQHKVRKAFYLMLHLLLHSPSQSVRYRFSHVKSFLSFFAASGYPSHPSEADHITAMSGDFVVFNCEVNFPNDQVVPYVVQWWRKVIFHNHYNKGYRR